MYWAAAEGGDAAGTVARIWHVTLDRFAAEPLTGQVLRILAWHAPAGIPAALRGGLADVVGAAVSPAVVGLASGPVRRLLC
jgi:hypothetical protein